MSPLVTVRPSRTTVGLHRLVLPAGDFAGLGERQADAVEQVFTLLEPWVRPLDVEFSVYTRGEFERERSNVTPYTLLAAEAPGSKGAREVVDHRERVTPQITGAALRSFLAEALAEVSATAVEQALLNHLWVAAAWFRLDSNDVDFQGVSPEDIPTAAIAGQTWVAGPVDSAKFGPMSISMFEEEGDTVVSLKGSWEPWQEGLPWMDDFARHLAQSGWELLNLRAE